MGEGMQHSSIQVNELIVKAAAHDRPAMESLLLHFYDPLLSFVRKLVVVGSGIAPEDVVQMTMTEAFQRIWSLEPRGGEAFFAWLKTIARTRLANLIEARHAQKRGEGRQPITQVADADGTEKSILRLIAGPARSPSLIARRTEANSAVKLAMTQLDPHRRHLITLRYGQELSYEEIASREGKSVGAVKMLIHRTLQELRDLIARDLGEFSIGE
jgi:RNA polymerase sigma factor (sigma-70 family)